MVIKRCTSISTNSVSDGKLFYGKKVLFDLGFNLCVLGEEGKLYVMFHLVDAKLSLNSRCILYCTVGPL